MNHHQRRRRQLLGWPAALALAGGLPRQAQSHSFPEEGFTVLHPWCDEASAGSTDLPVLLRIVDVRRADRLLGAQTPVASHMVLHHPPRPGLAAPSLSDQAGGQGLPLQPGQDLNLTHFGPHLLIGRVLTDLHFGYEYPLTLHFEQAGEVVAALIIGVIEATALSS